MPATLAKALSDQELSAIVQYLAGLPERWPRRRPKSTRGRAVASAPSSPKIEFASSKQIFFERCAGCHGTLRKGATGPALTPDKTGPKGTAALAAIIFNGTPRGMPELGQQGVLTQPQAEMMAKFLRTTAHAARNVAGADERNLEGVPAAGEAAHCAAAQARLGGLLRGHVARRRPGGDHRRRHVRGRQHRGHRLHGSHLPYVGDGALRLCHRPRWSGTIIDLWLEKPDKVARSKRATTHARYESSKYKGPEGDFSDKYAIVGCYWPPHFVMLDGLTLEPFKIVSTRSYTYDTEEYHPDRAWPPSSPCTSNRNGSSMSRRPVRSGW